MFRFDILMEYKHYTTKPQAQVELWSIFAYYHTYRALLSDSTIQKPQGGRLGGRDGITSAPHLGGQERGVGRPEITYGTIMNVRNGAYTISNLDSIYYFIAFGLDKVRFF